MHCDIAWSTLPLKHLQGCKITHSLLRLWRPAESSKSLANLSCLFNPFHLSDRDKGLGIKRFSFKHQENILPLSILSISHFWHPSHSASTQTFHLSKLAPPASLENGWLNLHWKSNATKADWIIGKPGMPKGIALVAAYNAYAFWLHQVELVVWCFSKTRDCSSKNVKDFH